MFNYVPGEVLFIFHFTAGLLHDKFLQFLLSFPPHPTIFPLGYCSLAIFFFSHFSFLLLQNYKMWATPPLRFLWLFVFSSQPLKSRVFAFSSPKPKLDISLWNSIGWTPLTSDPATRPLSRSGRGFRRPEVGWVSVLCRLCVCGTQLQHMAPVIALPHFPKESEPAPVQV